MKLSEDSLNLREIKSLYWDKNYTIEEIAKRFNVSFWEMYHIMNKLCISRRGRSETGFLISSSKPQFIIKDNLTIAEEKLKIAGIMLYWAEGTLKGNTVDFVNSNPQMIKIFLKFLRDICGVKEERLRVYLYVYSAFNVAKLKKYWNMVTGIPIRQFTKPYIRQVSSNLSNRKLPYGLVHIRYNDKKLLQVLENWIKEYSSNTLTIRAGTQAAKGDRLCKRSVLPKGRMEK
ncbi:MAG: hypothetical protein PHN59_02120 [Candidatus Omnitrophica bacterium]|nr:hypothetical protein [Candidatus Omnitrophota bacterium]